jgi:hypothetical protein
MEKEKSLEKEKVTSNEKVLHQVDENTTQKHGTKTPPSKHPKTPPRTDKASTGSNNSLNRETDMTKYTWQWNR